MVLKGEKLMALWWLANGANWFREREMEKRWQSHLGGKHGRASQTAQLTVWWRKIQGGGVRRGVIQAETQAHICELPDWQAAQKQTQRNNRILNNFLQPEMTINRTMNKCAPRREFCFHNMQNWLSGSSFPEHICTPHRETHCLIFSNTSYFAINQ